MTNEKFIKNKLDLLSKDKQGRFTEFVGPLTEMAEQGTLARKVEIPSDGNWFNVSF